MAIRGEKPSGYFSTFDGDGRRIEGESRQCVHCQFTWEYKPGSGIKRGWCSRCKGIICAREECLKAQRGKTGNTIDCLPFEDEDNWRREKLLKVMKGVGGKLTSTPGGLIIPS